jgi:hypothetical protein
MWWDFVVCLLVMFGLLSLFFLPTWLHKPADEDLVAVAWYLDEDALQKARGILAGSGIRSVHSRNKTGRPHPFDEDGGVQTGPTCLKVMSKDADRARSLLSQTPDLRAGV